ncbi:MAG: hypothetical protein HYR71_06450, partial [Chloroflexi bacterium]|nr:hypothetical protein [Chloroflexota bacterium]
MILARVVGRVVATVKYRGLEGVKFLIVQPLDKQRIPKGEPVIAADGTVYIGSTNSTLLALRPDGSKKWEFISPQPNGAV